MKVWWVYKVYFNVNLSCEEANLNKLRFVKRRLWLFLNERLAFLSNFVGRFYWRFGLFWKNKSGNPEQNILFLSRALFLLHYTFKRISVGRRSRVSTIKTITSLIKYILTIISCIWQLHLSQYCLQKLFHIKYIQLKFQKFW